MLANQPEPPLSCHRSFSYFQEPSVASLTEAGAFPCNSNSDEGAFGRGGDLAADEKSTEVRRHGDRDVFVLDHHRNGFGKRRIGCHKRKCRLRRDFYIVVYL